MNTIRWILLAAGLIIISCGGEHPNEREEIAELQPFGSKKPDTDACPDTCSDGQICDPAASYKCVAVSGTSYYVDPTAPAGGNGSFAKPWKSASQINSHTFADGDNLFFRVNTTLEMNAKIRITWNGTATNRAIIGSYYGKNQFGLRSDDNRPVLRGSFYRDPDGPHVPTGNYDALIDCARDQAQYITVQDLEARESYSAGIRVTGVNHTRGSSVREIIIRNNIVRDAGGQSIVLNFSHNGLIENNLVDGTCTRPGRNPSKPKKVGTGAGIVIMGGNRNYLSLYNVIRGNTVRRGFEMIGVYRGPRYTTIENNIIYDLTDAGVYVENAMYGTISGNLIYNTATVWWPPYQAEDKGIQAGVMVDSEDADGIVRSAGGFDIFNNRIAHAQFGIILASRSAHEGTGHILSRVYNNRIVDSKTSNLFVQKGSNDTLAHVKATWADNYFHGNYSFIYSEPIRGTDKGFHAQTDNWPSVKWGLGTEREGDWNVITEIGPDKNFFTTATAINPPTHADGAYAWAGANESATRNYHNLVKQTGWRNLTSGELKWDDFRLVGEDSDPIPPPTVTCTGSGFVCCAACQSGTAQSALDSTCSGADVCCGACAAMPPPPSPSARKFRTIDGEAVIEAEGYTRLGGTIGGTWSINKGIPGYSGTSYIQSSIGGGKSGTFDKDIIRAEYDINFQETGRYYLHLRTYAVDHTQNGFYATLDGLPIDYGYVDNTYVFVGKRTKWWWLTKGGGPEGRPPGPYKVSINITKTGVQTLALYRRDSGGSRIDMIWLTKHESEIQDTGTLSLTDPAVFIVP